MSFVGSVGNSDFLTQRAAAPLKLFIHILHSLLALFEINMLHVEQAVLVYFHMLCDICSFMLICIHACCKVVSLWRRINKSNIRLIPDPDVLYNCIIS